MRGAKVERTQCKEGEEGAEEVDVDEYEVYADDTAAALPHLVVWREEADSDEDGSDGTDDYHGVIDAAVVEGLLGCQLGLSWGRHGKGCTSMGPKRSTRVVDGKGKGSEQGP